MNNKYAKKVYITTEIYDLFIYFQEKTGWLGKRSLLCRDPSVNDATQEV